MPKLTSEAQRAATAQIQRQKAKLAAQKADKRHYTFSHMVMAGIMMMFFVGVGLGVYSVVTKADDLTVVLNFIMELARIVCLGYFIKAFGENIARIVLSAIFGNRLPDPMPKPPKEGGRVE
jgi:TctA family transporter